MLLRLWVCASRQLQAFGQFLGDHRVGVVAQHEMNLMLFGSQVIQTLGINMPLAPVMATTVTGGAGFIGSHLVERLLADGKSVVVIDDCSTGRLENLKDAAANPALRIIQSKVSQCAELRDVAKSAEAIYHLAAAVGVELVVNSPIHVIESNLHETEALFKAAAPARVPILFTSTSEVYGKSQKPAFTEEDDLLIGPPHFGRWSYACSKLMDEFLALAYAREHKLPVVIARLFNSSDQMRKATDLLQIVCAANANRLGFGFGESGQQKTCEDCYDGDND